MRKLSFQGADFTGQNGWVYGEKYLLYIHPPSSFHTFMCEWGLEMLEQSLGWGKASETSWHQKHHLHEAEVSNQ